MGAGAGLLNGCAPQLVPAVQVPYVLGSPAPYVTPVPSSTPRIVSPTPAVTSTVQVEPTLTPEIQPTPSSICTPAPASQYFGLNLCFVLWDHQLEKYNYRPRNTFQPVPETCPLYSGDTNPLTPAWVSYWKGILHLLNPNMNDADFELSWGRLVQSDRAFTNGTGPETRHFAIHSVTCAGATHAMVTGIPEILPKGYYMRIYTLNWHKGPPPIPTDPDGLDMTRHFFATTGSTHKLPDGSYAVNGFPQFENCIVPLISQSDTDLIDATRIKKVTGLQRPYNP